jgi:hypothetical protein
MGINLQCTADGDILSENRNFLFTNPRFRCCSLQAFGRSVPWRERHKQHPQNLRSKAELHVLESGGVHEGHGQAVKFTSFYVTDLELQQAAVTLRNRRLLSTPTESQKRGKLSSHRVATTVPSCTVHLNTQKMNSNLLRTKRNLLYTVEAAYYNRG